MAVTNIASGGMMLQHDTLSQPHMRLARLPLLCIDACSEPSGDGA